MQSCGPPGVEFETNDLNQAVTSSSSSETEVDRLPVCPPGVSSGLGWLHTCPPPAA